MPSLRTQIYLTAQQRQRLDARARREHKTLAQLVREAIDAHLDESEPDFRAALTSTFGRMPDLEVPARGEWDRGYG
jgi:predicted DNA-binding protein